MLVNLILFWFLDVLNAQPNCQKGENNCKLCNPVTKLCIECNYNVFIPDNYGGCEKANVCDIGKNYCIECTEDEKLCKTCEEGYFPDENGGCSYSFNCEVSFRGNCLQCKENYILIENINVCKSLNLEEFKNCENINTLDGTCEKCIDGYFLTSEDKKCIKTDNCTESIFDKCIQCNKGYYLDKKEEKCLLQKGNLLYCKEVIDGENCNICENNYYFDQEGNCTSTNYCQKRGELGSCQECISGYFLSYFGNTCTSSENCYTGIKGVGVCDKCFSGYYIDFKDGKCKSNKENNDFKNCVKADGNCIECAMGYFLGEDYKCTSTVNCAESINDICVECKENYYLGLDKKCSKYQHCIYSNNYECLECESNYYFDKSSQKCKIWDEKFENCKYGYEKSGCDRCKDDFYLNKTNKLCYSNLLNGDFYKCAMTDSYGRVCSDCVKGYFLGYKYHRCSFILGCVLQENDDKCIECNSFKCLDVKTGKCEDNNNKDIKKYYKCKKTNEEGTACAECLEGMSLDEDGFCVFLKKET